MKKKTIALAVAATLALTALALTNASVNAKGLVKAGSGHSDHDAGKMNSIGFDWRNPTKDGYRAYYRCPECCSADPSSSRFSIANKAIPVSEEEIKLTALTPVEPESVKDEAIAKVDASSNYGLDQASDVTYFVNDEKKNAVYFSRSRDESKSDGSFASTDYSSFSFSSNLEEGAALGSLSFSYRYLNYSTLKRNDSETSSPFALKMSFAYGEESKSYVLDQDIVSDEQWHTLSFSVQDVLEVESLLNFSKLTFKFSELEGYFMISSLSFSSETKTEMDKRLGATPVLAEDCKSLTYGLYPKDHVKDETTLASLNKLQESEMLNGYYFLDGEYYAKEKCIVSVADHSGFLTFDDDVKIYKNVVYWFKCEPIKWNVLTEDSESHLYDLISDVLLDVHRYNESYDGLKDDHYANNYEHSELRNWLNNDFYWKAFVFDRSCLNEAYYDDTEKSTGQDTTVGNPYVSGLTLSDKVYLQSAADISSNGDPCAMSDWTKAAGCDFIESWKIGSHWTRSASHDGSNLALIAERTTNIVDANVARTDCGVRPCIRVSLS